MSRVAAALFVPQLLWNKANIQTHDSLIRGPRHAIRAWTLEKKIFIQEPKLDVDAGIVTATDQQEVLGRANSPTFPT